MKLKRITLSLLALFAFLNTQSQTITLQTSGTINDLSGVHFFSPTHGAVCGFRVILNTTDGGLTWNNNPILASWSDVFMTSNNTFYVTATTGTLVKTIDGGANFTVLTTNTQNNLNSVFFITPQIGWISGQGGTVLKTINAGTTWTAQNLNTQTFIYQVFFIDQNIGWAVGAGEKVFATTNGGTTWTPQTANLNGFYNFQDVNFINANEGWLIGNNGGTGNVMFKTTNGGATWTNVYTNIGNPQNEIQFFDSNLGYSAFVSNTNSSTGIRTTTNGGTSWTVLPVPATNSNFNSIFFLNQNLGFSVGDAGKIIKIQNSTGLNSQRSTIDFKLYPNPASDFIFLETNEKDLETIIIYDLLGKVILKQENTISISNPIQIPTHSIKNGIYLMEIISKSKKGIQKLVVQHD